MKTNDAVSVSDETVAGFVEKAAVIISNAPFPNARSYVKARQVSDLALESFALGKAAQTSIPALDDDLILVPRGLLGAACCAIERKHDAQKTLSKLRRYTTGDLSNGTAAQPSVPVANDELPGLWSASDFTGGDPDERGYSELTEASDGWKLVPVEPETEMLVAANRIMQQHNLSELNLMAAWWCVMVSAAPSPSE